MLEIKEGCPKASVATALLPTAHSALGLHQGFNGQKLL